MTVGGRIDLKDLGRKCVNFSDEWLKRADWFVGNLGACPEGVTPLNLVNISYSSLVENPQRAIKSMYEKMDIPFSDEFKQALEQELKSVEEKSIKGDRREMAQKYPEGYSLEEYGISETLVDDRFRAYNQKYKNIL
jgi:hypothetical protein